MKQTNVKRAVAATLGCAFLVAAVGCSSSSSSSVATPTPTPTDTVEDGTIENPYENLQMGLGIVVSADADGLTDSETMSTSGTVSHVAVTVLLENDVICGSLLDEHESNVSSVDSGLALPAEVQSKRELGDTYGMRTYSSIGKEWYEQADAFCTYIQGMTCEEVMAIEVDEYGKTTEVDLAAGCTISITSFQEAVEKACENAKAVSDMDIEDYTNYKNESTSFWDDLVDGTEDVLEGVEDGVEDVVDGADNVVDDVLDGSNDSMNATENASY